MIALVVNFADARLVFVLLALQNLVLANCHAEGCVWANGHFLGLRIPFVRHNDVDE